MKVERSTYGLRVTGLGDRHPKGLTLPARQGERLVRLLLVEHRSVSADRHPLALFHYRLLERPFVRDLILRDNMFPKNASSGRQYGNRARRDQGTVQRRIRFQCPLHAPLPFRNASPVVVTGFPGA